MLKEVRHTIDLSRWSDNYKLAHTFVFDCRDMTRDEVIDEARAFMHVWRVLHPAWEQTMEMLHKPVRAVGTVKLSFVEKWTGIPRK